MKTELNSETYNKSTEVGLKVSLIGIVEMFGNKLYSEFGAIVRELVQNGHDAALVHYIQHNNNKKSLSDYWVNVRFDSIARVLIISDNGVGMDADDVSKSLNDFALPKKNEVREVLSNYVTEDPLYIIGIYGVGFLSALAISEKVEVWSRRANKPPLVWQYQKGQTNALITEVDFENFDEVFKKHGLLYTDQESSGTIVICHLSEEIEREYAIESSVIERSLFQFGRLLKIPIYYNGKKINLNQTAWNNPGRASNEDWTEMIKETTSSSPLLVIPIYSSPSELDIEGVLWIPERKKILGDRGYIDVFIRRMFVMQAIDLLLPRWAEFMMGMINTNKLDRVVSGSDIIRDKNLILIQKFINKQLLSAFKQLRNLPQGEYWKIMGSYDDIIKLKAADHEEFLEFVWDKLRINGRHQRHTIPEYLAEVKHRGGQENSIYYYNKSVQEFSANIVSDATKIPVLPLWTLNDFEFVNKLCSVKKINFLPYTELAANIIKKPEDESNYQGLIAACAAENIAAEVREFDPNDMPALLIEDNELQERKKDWLHLLQARTNRVDQKLAEDIQNVFLRGGALNKDVSFYLNARNKLIQALSKSNFETQRAICSALYNVSYMSIMPQLGRSEIQGVYDSICSVLMRLVNQEPTAPENPCKPTRIFMITPFAKEYKVLEQAVRQVFEGPPYLFQVVLARDFMQESTLLENIRTHIEAADAFVAEISDLNPNVMLELGAVLIKRDKNRPVFLLKAENSEDLNKREVPEDIRSELYIPYSSLSASSDSISEGIRNAIEHNSKPIHKDIIHLLEKRSCKALTKHLLSLTRFTKDEQESVLKHFTTVEDLLAVKPSVLSKVAGITQQLAEFTQKELKDFIER